MSDTLDFNLPAKIFKVHEKKREASDSARPPRKPGSPFWASELGKCARQITYSFSGLPGEAVSGRSSRIFAAGDAFEEVAVAELRAAGFKVTDQQKRITYTHPPISGKIDGIIAGRIAGEDVTRLLELKTMNSRSFAEFKRKGLLEAQPGYYVQIQAYMFALGLEEATVLAGSKDDSDLFEETVAFDPYYLADQILRLLSISNAVQAGKLAEPEFPKSSWQCKFCAYSERCDGLPQQPRAAKLAAKGGKRTAGA